MSSNSLVNFQLLFQQSEQNIKKLLSLISPFVEKKNTAIANFLAVEQVKLIWLIRILNVEYDKQFSSPQSLSRTAIKNIAKSISLNLNETNTLNYDQTLQNNIVYNTLQLKLPLSPSHNDNLSPHQDDIISLLSDTDMDYLQDFNNSHISLTNHHQLFMQNLST